MVGNTLERKRIIEDALENRELWLTIIESALASVIILSALVGNIVLCLSIYRFRSLRKIQNYYVVALAISDFLLNILCALLGLVVLFLGRWPFGDTICQIQGALTYFFACFSLLNVTLIALNRYVKMVRSADIYQKIYTKNNVLLSIAVSAFFSGIFIIPFAIQRFSFHPGQLACFPCKSEDKSKQALILSPYAALIAVTYPFMAFCYYKVFRKVRAHFNQVAASTLPGHAMKLFSEEVKITKILFAILIAFVICWTPVFAIEFLDTLQGEYRLDRHVYFILPLAGVTSSAVNPVIYGLTQKRFRVAYKKVLTCQT